MISGVYQAFYFDCPHQDAGGSLEILRQSILDTRLSAAMPGEELAFNILASIAQFECQISRVRQREKPAA